MAGGGAAMAVDAGIDLDIVRDRDRAQKRVDRFRVGFVDLYGDLYGEAMLDFACHAAFPLALTTEVVYLLRQRYFPGLDWAVAAEVLLSNLCEVAGHDLYVMDVAVRRVLLDRLVERFSGRRVDALAVWMAGYIQHRLATERSRRVLVLGHPSHWTALACLRSDDEVTQAIKVELGRLLAEADDPNERFRLSALMKSQADLMRQRGLEPIKLGELKRRFVNGLPLDEDEQLVQMQAVMVEAGFPRLEVKQVEAVTLVEAVEAESSELKSFPFEVVTVDGRGEEIDRQSHKANYYTETLPEGLNLEMVAIPSGTFRMGSRKSEIDGSDSERPRHQVTVAPFFMGKYAVTQAQWRSVTSLPQVNRKLDLDPARFKGENRPVEQVSWLDAEEFCLRLSVATGRTYRLPSEAEWEYACRAATQTPFHFGETITPDLANFDGNYTYAKSKKGLYREETTAVGDFTPNVFGLYDMHGNVSEWCLDHWHDTYEGAPTDGRPWLSNDENARRIRRGGSWFFDPWLCRSAYRYRSNPSVRDLYIGFRVVCIAPPEAP
jgi:formylglycine-generating enzyme required for sulfatase activity